MTFLFWLAGYLFTNAIVDPDRKAGYIESFIRLALWPEDLGKAVYAAMNTRKDRDA